MKSQHNKIASDLYHGLLYMKMKTNFILALTLSLILLGCNSQPNINLNAVDNEDIKYRNLAQSNLEKATKWLIEDGVFVFTSKGKQGLHRKLVDEWGVQIWTDPWIETEFYLTQFRIKARGIHHQIINLFRREFEDKYYEYWVVKIVGTDWAGVDKSAKFLITVTDKIDGHRVVLKESDQFIIGFGLSETIRFQLPDMDLSILYELEAWEFSKNYKQSELKNKKVILNKNGEYELVN